MSKSIKYFNRKISMSCKSINWISITRKRRNSRKTTKQFESVAREFRVFFSFYSFIRWIVPSYHKLHCFVWKLIYQTTCADCVGVTNLIISRRFFYFCNSRLHNEIPLEPHVDAILHTKLNLRYFAVCYNSEYRRSRSPFISIAVYSIYVMQSVSDRPSYRK